MMGKGHATMGAAVWLTGCAAAQTIGLDPSLPVITIGAAVCAGWALAPDLDHPNSTVARCAGPVSQMAAHGVAALSRAVHNRTRTRWDRPNPDGHRLLTHTAVWAAVCGALAAAAGRWAGPMVAAALVAFPAQLGLRVVLPWQYRRIRIRTGFRARCGRSPFFRTLFGQPGQRLARTIRYVPVPVPDILAVGFAAVVYYATPGSGWWLGIAVAAGVLIHCAGDAVTNSACPILGLIPLPVTRQRPDGTRHRVGWAMWKPVGPPRTATVRFRGRSWTFRTRFDTGGWFETRVVQPALTLTIVFAAMWLLWPAFMALSDTATQLTR